MEGRFLVEKEDSVSPVFLALTITDKVLKAVSTAEWEALSIVTSILVFLTGGMGRGANSPQMCHVVDTKTFCSRF